MAFHEAHDLPDPQMSEVYARMSVKQRLAVAAGLQDTARAIATSAVKRQHPEWTPAQIRGEVARRFLSDDQ